MKHHVDANWSHAVLVCKKCSKKLKGGFGPDGSQKLSKELKARLGSKKGRKGHLGVIEVGCLDVCPKKAVMLVDSRHPGVWRIVRPDADLDALAGELAAAD